MVVVVCCTENREPKGRGEMDVVDVKLRTKLSLHRSIAFANQVSAFFGTTMDEATKELQHIQPQRHSQANSTAPARRNLLPKTNTPWSEWDEVCFMKRGWFFKLAPDPQMSDRSFVIQGSMSKHLTKKINVFIYQKHVHDAYSRARFLPPFLPFDFWRGFGGRNITWVGHWEPTARPEILKYTLPFSSTIIDLYDRSLVELNSPKVQK